jgi:hypothetical protein
MTGRGLLLLVAVLGASPAGDTVVVKREGARVMRAPRFFGEACAAGVAPGQRLRLVERRGGWARLASPGDGRCWLHETAWLDRSPGELVGNPSAASTRDIELAGRGFSESEEALYRSENPSLAAAFAALDTYLAAAPEAPPQELAGFCAAGRLGGAP